MVLCSEIERLKSQLDHALIKVSQLTKRGEGWEHKYATVALKNEALETQASMQNKRDKTRDENDARL